MEIASPPWGTWTVLLEEPDFKVKCIEVLPRCRLSYQKHSQRQEHWFIVRGSAKIVLDDQILLLSEGQSLDIKRESAHRIENTGENVLIFIEVQMGRYLGEDDIIRLSDDYGRQ
jgi:mannose-6-phosphate isomerase